MGWRHTPEVEAPTWGWELLSSQLFRALAWVGGTCLALGHPHEFGAPLVLSTLGVGAPLEWRLLGHRHPLWMGHPPVPCPRPLTPPGLPGIVPQGQSTQHPEHCQGLCGTPTHELGVCGAGEGSGHLGCHPDGTSRPSTRCHRATGSARFTWDFRGSQNLALTDAAVSVPFGRGADEQTPSFSASWPSKYLPAEAVCVPRSAGFAPRRAPRCSLQRRLRPPRPRCSV